MAYLNKNSFFNLKKPKEKDDSDEMINSSKAAAKGANSLIDFVNSKKKETTTTEKPSSPISGVSQGTYDQYANHKYDLYGDPLVQNVLSNIEGIRKQLENPSAKANLDDLFSQIQNREDFSYDFSTDPMFQNMLSGQQVQGSQAMQDAIAQAAGLTGGYASSWAQSVGNQAYNQHLQSAYEQLPAYQQMAFNAYEAEGQDLLNQYSLAADLYEKERQGLLDQLGMSEAELDRAMKIYDTNYSKDASLYEALLGYEREDETNRQNMALNGYVQNANGDWVLSDSAKAALEAEQNNENYEKLVKSLKEAKDNGNLYAYINQYGLDFDSEVLQTAMKEIGLVPEDFYGDYGYVNSSDALNEIVALLPANYQYAIGFGEKSEEGRKAAEQIRQKYENYKAFYGKNALSNSEIEKYLAAYFPEDSKKS